MTDICVSCCNIYPEIMRVLRKKKRKVQQKAKKKRNDNMQNSRENHIFSKT